MDTDHVKEVQAMARRRRYEVRSTVAGRGGPFSRWIVWDRIRECWADSGFHRKADAQESADLLEEEWRLEQEQEGK